LSLKVLKELSCSCDVQSFGKKTNVDYNLISIFSL
jgi:hypothetical protein